MPAEPSGVQNERTSLSWQRTALSLLAACAVLARLAYGRLGPAALVGVALPVALSLLVLHQSRERYRRRAIARHRHHTGGGTAPAALAAGVTALALLELAMLVFS